MQLDKILQADLNDIIFEGRNKQYGAYYLRKIYNKNITRATLLGIFLILFAFSIPFIKELLEKQIETKKPLNVVDVTKLAAPPPLDKTTPPPPPPDLPPPPPKTIRFTPPVIKPDEEVPQNEEPPVLQDLKNVDPGTTTTQIDPNAEVSFNDAPVTVTEPPPTKPLMFVEQMPSFPGGEQALQEYLYKNIRYPAAARENGIEGTVVLQFVVGSDGAISEIKVLRDVKGGCTDEAIRVVKNMPKWTAGKQNGVAVPVFFNLPVTFKLASE